MVCAEWRPVILLVSGATYTVRQMAAAGARGLGCLLRPGNGNFPIDGLPWAADNGCFAGFDEPAFLAMLAKVAKLKGCHWVTAPDVVADAGATVALLAHWGPRIRALGLPVALVAQDGLTVASAPWDQFDALFIGGSTAWKLSDAARDLVAEAKRRGMRTHMGRVNTVRRLRVAITWGVDSVDGTAFSRFPATKIPGFLRAMGELGRQGSFGWA